MLREDLGGGYNDLTFVFSKQAQRERKLKRAFLHSGDLPPAPARTSRCCRQLGLGLGQAQRRGQPDRLATSAIVPDEYDPLYAKCGSGAAVDTLIKYYRDKYPLLTGLSASRDENKIHKIAHQCVIDGSDGKIHTVAKDNDMDVEGSAPGTFVALKQMMARFEDMDLTVARMADEKPTEEDDTIAEGEALLKQLEAEEKAGQGVK